MAENSMVFTEAAEKILGVKVEIISGDQEALLSSRGAALGLDEHGDLATIDIGGQSTEVCWQASSGAIESRSIPLGVVELTRKYLKSDIPQKAEVKELEEEVRRVIAGSIPKSIRGNVVGVAGTATTLGWLDLGLDTWQRGKVHGHEMSLEAVEMWLNRMVALTSKQRQKQYGIRAIRADVFPAGLVVLKEFLLYLGQGVFIISANGLRVGVALSLLGKG
jgi:exopolyphosphatase/guanosine-5'-triphosphate,3'-diphosphate pyrophosphatase